MDDTANVIISLGQCFLFAIAYVGSLYVMKSPFPRDHPRTIKQRMIAVSGVCIVGPIFMYCYGDYTYYAGMEIYSFMRLLGLHTENIFIAFVLPLLLTILLFLGPIVLNLTTDGLAGTKEQIFNWNHLYDLKWYRTFVVGPLSEELIFRACMLPLLVPKFGLSRSVFIAPLLFGVAHFHHIIEELRSGRDLLPVVLTSCFHMTYTTIFGAYSAFMFLRTGHLIGPVVCHSFCNMMGFPDFESISYSVYPKLIICVFVLGLVLFITLLFPLTNPEFYHSIYWQ